MKKTICILLSLLALFTLAACEGEQTDAAAPKYAFVANGVEMKIDAPAEPILASLGEPKDYNESPSCAFEGLDKIYVYDGFKIETYPLNGKDYISQISLDDDTFATREGISIGATRDQVVTAYGNPTEESSTDMVYRDTQTKSYLQFLLRDGNVTNIYYVKQTDTE